MIEEYENIDLSNLNSMGNKLLETLATNMQISFKRPISDENRASVIKCIRFIADNYTPDKLDDIRNMRREYRKKNNKNCVNQITLFTRKETELLSDDQLIFYPIADNISGYYFCVDVDEQEKIGYEKTQKQYAKLPDLFKEISQEHTIQFDEFMKKVKYGPECEICYENTTKNNPLVSCPVCNYTTCKRCLRSTILLQNTEPHCMNNSKKGKDEFGNDVLVCGVQFTMKWLHDNMRDSHDSISDIVSHMIKKEIERQKLSLQNPMILERAKDIIIQDARRILVEESCPVFIDKNDKVSKKVFDVSKHQQDRDIALYGNRGKKLSPNHWLPMGVNDLTSKFGIPNGESIKYKGGRIVFYMPINAKRIEILRKEIKSDKGKEFRHSLEIMRKYNAPFYLENKINREEKTIIIMNCSFQDCKGYVKQVDVLKGDYKHEWKCSFCDSKYCTKCGVRLEKDTCHKCNKNDIATLTEIRKNTKPCPKCNAHIFKIYGCDQMFCTICKTAFSWETGQIETGRIHNPHYYEEMRKGNTLRFEGEICGGLPDIKTGKIKYDNNYDIIPSHVRFARYHRLATEVSEPRMREDNYQQLYNDKTFSIIFDYLRNMNGLDERTREEQFNKKITKAYLKFLYDRSYSELLNVFSQLMTRGFVYLDKISNEMSDKDYNIEENKVLDEMEGLARYTNVLLIGNATALGIEHPIILFYYFGELSTPKASFTFHKR